MKIVLPECGLPCPGVVSWFDAGIDQSLDVSLEELEEVDGEIQQCLTYGLIIKVGRTNIVLAVDRFGSSLERFRGIQRIPRKMLLAPPIWLGPLDCSTGKGMSGLEKTAESS